jgi:hypothetical protein
MHVTADYVTHTHNKLYDTHEYRLMLHFVLTTPPQKIQPIINYDTNSFTQSVG